jgi:hypothetical protein
MVWRDWSFIRLVILLLGVAYLMISVQVMLFHYRQNFRHLAMWLPVLGGPVIGLCAVLLALLNLHLLLGLFRVLSWVILIAGVVGFYYHLRGVGQRVGGYGMNNILIGPPIVLPLMFSALSIIGLFAAYWR